jgi:hypothetical protein
VTQRVTIAFADAGAAIAGVAIVDSGSLVYRDEQLSAAREPILSGAAPAWTLAATGAYELRLEALGEPAKLASGAEIWLCRANGRLEGHDLEALATLTAETPGARLDLERSLSITFTAELAFALAARRPRGAGGHGDEELEAVLWRGEPGGAITVERPRLSTTYDASGLARHAGIELWEDEEAEYAIRIGGEAVTNGEILDPGGARTRVVFMAWHHGSHHTLGSYTLTGEAER